MSATVEAPRGDNDMTTSKGRKTSSLERVTVNLTPRSAEALDRSVDLTRDSKTDTINRALQTYVFLMETIARGGAILVRTSEHAEPEPVHFL